MAQPLVTVIFRLEKIVDAKTLYIEFQKGSQNGVLRLWNIINRAGLSVAKKERENFQTSEDAQEYLKNARAQYESQGFKAPAVEPVLE